MYKNKKTLLSNTIILKAVFFGYCSKSRKFKISLVPILSLTVISCVIEFFILKRTTVIFRGETDAKSMLLKAVYLVFFHVFSSVLKKIYNLIIINVVADIEAEVLMDLMNILINNENDFFNKKESSVHITNFNRTARSVSSIVYYFLCRVVPLIFSTGTAFFYFFSEFKVKGCIPFALAILFCVIAFLKFTKLAMRFNSNKNHSENNLNSEISARIENKKLINEMNTEKSEIESFENFVERRKKDNKNCFRIKPISEMVCDLIIYTFKFYIFYIFIYNEDKNLQDKAAALSSICSIMEKVRNELNHTFQTFKEIVYNISDIKTGRVIKNILTDEQGFIIVKPQIEISEIEEKTESDKIVLTSNLNKDIEHKDGFKVSIDCSDCTEFNNKSIFELENINRKTQGIFISIYLNNSLNIENRIKNIADLGLNPILLSEYGKKIKIRKILIKYKDFEEIRISEKDKILIFSKEDETEINNFLLFLKNPISSKLNLIKQTHKIIFQEVYKNKISFLEDTTFWDKRTMVENIQYGNSIKKEDIKKILVFLGEKNILLNFDCKFGKSNLKEKEKIIISFLRFAFRKSEIYLVTDFIKGHKKEELLIGWLFDYLSEKTIIIGYNCDVKSTKNINKIIKL